jgi:hypothetical protein
MIVFWHWEYDEYDSDEPIEPIEPCCHKFIAGDRVYTVKEKPYFEDQFGTKRSRELYDRMQGIVDKLPDP